MSYYRPADFQNGAVWKRVAGGTNLLTSVGVAIGGLPEGCTVIGVAYEWDPFASVGIKTVVNGGELVKGGFGIEDLTNTPQQFAPAGTVIRAYFQPFRGAFDGSPPGFNYLQPWPSVNPDDWFWQYAGVSSVRLIGGAGLETPAFPGDDIPVPEYEVFGLYPPGVPPDPDPPPPAECPPVPRQPWPYGANRPGVGPRQRGNTRTTRPVTGNKTPPVTTATGT